MAGAQKQVKINDDEGFEEDLANFLGDNYSTEEETEQEEETFSVVPIAPAGEAASFWKNPDLPEKFPLDHVNVENLVNMLSKIHLVWPEDLPYYDDLEYSTEPERAKFPASYYHNTDKEKVVLWHAENFRRQFIHNFPDRRPLVIAPRNECGCQKIFCSYINPTSLGYPDFTDCVTTVEFLKDFFTPDLLTPPTKFPDRIRSHLTVIKKRKANAFEMAVIIVSILIGAGYDAYVVDGFASKTLCTIDTTEDYEDPPDKPILDYEIVEIDEKDEKKDFTHAVDYGFLLDREEKDAVATVSPSKYRFKKKAVSAMDAAAADAAEGGRRGGGGDMEVSSNSDPTPPKAGALVTIEDGTTVGDAATTLGNDDDEEAVEETIAATTTEGLTVTGDDVAGGGSEEDEEEEEQSEIDEELAPGVKDRYHGKRTHAWILVLAGKREEEETFFLEPFSGTKRAIRDPNFLAIEAVFNHKNYWINIQPTVANLRKLNYNLDDGSAWSKLLLESDSRKKKKKVDTGNAGMFQDDDEDEFSVKPGDLFLTMPVSWTTELEISQEDYDRKYPDGSKTIEYNDAIVEVAAPYANPDGLVRKVLKFLGASRDPEDLIYIEEDFKHRKDKLRKRKWHRDGKILNEYFDKGRKDALKEHVHVSGRNKPDYPRDLYYYSESHPRSVSHRQIIKKGMIERFEGRDDHLYYKMTLFGGILCNTIPTKEDVQRSKARHIIELVKGAGVGGGGSKKRARRNIVKIVEKYKRNEEKEAKYDIAEKHMLIEEGRLRVLFHYEPGNFTRNTLEFLKNVKQGQSKYAPIEFKPEDCVEYQADIHADPMNVYKKFALLQQLDRDERSSSVLSREAEDEVFQTVSSRVQEDWRHEIEPDAYAGDRSEEYLRMKEQQTADENEEETDLSGTDFTTPFFEKYGVPRSKKDEILMKKRIMLHEKVKILRRAYMIKELYDKKAGHLREKQEWYLNHMDQMNASQEEDFNHMYKERLFQMHILEQRMARHQQEAPRQYYELLVQLLRHPQLNRFTNRKDPPPPPPERGLTEEERAKIAKELAKLKDCCQFFNVRFSEKKKRNTQDDDEALKITHEEMMRERRERCREFRRIKNKEEETGSERKDSNQEESTAQGETDVMAI